MCFAQDHLHIRIFFFNLHHVRIDSNFYTKIKFIIFVRYPQNV